MNLNSWDYYDFGKEIANMGLYELQKVFIREDEAKKELGSMALTITCAGGDITSVKKDFEYRDACQRIVALKIAKLLTGVK